MNQNWVTRYSNVNRSRQELWGGGGAVQSRVYGLASCQGEGVNFRQGFLRGVC